MRSKHHWDNQKLRILENAHGQSHFESSCRKFVEVPDGNYFRQASWDTGWYGCINHIHVVVWDTQGTCALVFDQPFSVRENEVNQCFGMVGNSKCWSFYHVLHIKLFEYPFIFFPSYDVSPRLSCSGLVLKSPRSIIFETFIQIFWAIMEKLWRNHCFGLRAGIF